MTMSCCFVKNHLAHGLIVNLQVYFVKLPAPTEDWYSFLYFVQKT